MNTVAPDNPFARSAGVALLQFLAYAGLEWWNDGRLTRADRKDFAKAQDDLVTQGGLFLGVEVLKDMARPDPVVPIGPPVPVFPENVVPIGPPVAVYDQNSPEIRALIASLNRSNH